MTNVVPNTDDVTGMKLLFLPILARFQHSPEPTAVMYVLVLRP